MAQQIAFQPPHDNDASVEYGKGGHFRASTKVVAGIILAILLLIFVMWLISALNI